MSEEVLCIDSSVLKFKINKKEDVNLYKFNCIKERLFSFEDNDSLSVLHRPGVETNYSVRQIIPYVILLNSKKQILSYYRNSKSAEERLRSKISIGFGGHISKHDLLNTFYETLVYSVKRELKEELNLNSNINISLDDLDYLIVSSESNVDKAHIGIVIFITLSEDQELEINNEKLEEGLEKFTWLNFDDLIEIKNASKLENWSEIVLSCKFLHELILK